jgi:hypothetical protein
MPWRRIGEWRYNSIILGLGTRRTCIVSFTLRPLNPQGKSPQCLFDKRLVGPKNWSGSCGVEKNSLAPALNLTPDLSARRYTDWAISAVLQEQDPCASKWNAAAYTCKNGNESSGSIRTYWLDEQLWTPQEQFLQLTYGSGRATDSVLNDNKYFLDLIIERMNWLIIICTPRQD